MARAKANGTTKEFSAADLTDQIEAVKKDIAALTEIMGEMTQQEAAKTKDHLSKRAAELRDAAAEKGAELRDAAAAKSGEVRDAAYERGGEAREQIGEYYGRAESAVREQPATAMGIAAGLGFLAGLLMSRRS
ncbi:MAG: hypothetical protein AAGL89_01040 [Pseudomonadota bacterium]